MSEKEIYEIVVFTISKGLITERLLELQEVGWELAGEISKQKDFFFNVPMKKKLNKEGLKELKENLKLLKSWQNY
jgi:hypothetical protein